MRQEPKITAEAFAALARAGVPWVSGLDWRIEHLAAGEIGLRLAFHEQMLRPGGTISGPALMALTDIALYGVVLSAIGRVDMAVTTDLTFHFLARPGPADVVATGRLLTLGRRLAVGEVEITSAMGDRRICHAVGTYALPAEPA